MVIEGPFSTILTEHDTTIAHVECTYVSRVLGSSASRRLVPIARGGPDVCIPGHDRARERRNGARASGLESGPQTAGIATATLRLAGRPRFTAPRTNMRKPIA